MPRPKKDDTPPAVQPLSEDVEAYHMKRILAARGELDRLTQERASANGVYRKLCKEARDAGIPNRSITEAINDRHMDPDEYAAYMRAKHRLLKLLGSPLGTQGSLFDAVGEQTAQNAVTPADRADEDTARAQGVMAGKAGKNLLDNPYDQDEAFGLYAAWKAGYKEGQNALAQQHFGKTGNGHADSVETMAKTPKAKGRRPPKGGVIEPSAGGNFPPTAA